MTTTGIHNIIKSREIGDKGENACTNLIRTWGFTVTNVSEVDEYRKRDIDLLCTDHKTDEDVTVEVKSDDRGAVTGNFFFEEISNCNSSTPGWAYYTECDFLLIKQRNVVHVLPGPKTVEWFKKNYKRFRQIPNTTTFSNGQKAYDSMGRIVSRATFDKEVGIIATIYVDKDGYPIELAEAM